MRPAVAIVHTLRPRWAALVRVGVCLAASVALWATSDARQVGPRSNASGPGVRNAHGLAFDGQTTVLFGGASERDVLAETWGWDGRAWRQLAASGPEGRTFPVMVAVPDAGALLFGGRRVLFGATTHPSQFLADLWSWDGRSWTPVLADGGPMGRAEAAGAWDPRRRRLVVFGGYASGRDAVEALGDTWEFGDGGWQAHAPAVAPSARHGAVAWYDVLLGEVVLFGGSGAAADTWSWNGARWLQRDAGTVPGRYNAAVSAGGDGLPVLRFGGWDGTRRRSDAWTWQIGGWQRVFASGPSPEARNHAALAFDSRRNRHVLFGGHDGLRVFGDVWEADARGWRRIFTMPPRRRVDNGH